jgi:hypothetical protein
LGHTIWRSKSLAAKFKQSVENGILSEIESRLKEYQDLYPNHIEKKQEVQSSIFVKQTIALPTEWAVKQCEEHFCDFVGLYLFDEAFLHSFAYLLSPQRAGQRSTLYPNTLTRVSKLTEAATKFRGTSAGPYRVPADYAALFENMAEPSDKERRKKFLLMLADAGSGAVASDLMDEVQSILSAAGIATLSEEGRKRILDAFKFIVPAVGAKNLTNILNAAWDVYHDKDFWSGIPQIQSRDRVLKELVLKNVEVLEIEQLLAEQT